MHSQFSVCNAHFPPYIFHVQCLCIKYDEEPNIRFAMYMYNRSACVVFSTSLSIIQIIALSLYTSTNVEAYSIMMSHIIQTTTTFSLYITIGFWFSGCLHRTSIKAKIDRNLSMLNRYRMVLYLIPASTFDSCARSTIATNVRKPT